MNPSYCSSCRGSDLILQLTWMFTRLAYHGCSTKHCLSCKTKSKIPRKSSSNPTVSHGFYG